ncbi:tigger transposable element-derived protein 6-like [Euwallacea similis]|uniref:tigger transposable element-derived protein 6-like n=1 Tax=Euwallacea similis TaxID=1736056 RepID=UPI00344EE732
MSLERITAMICANASGTKKRTLLIGTFQNPRSFKNINSLLINYFWDNKPWMMSSIFTSCFKKWDREFLKEKRKTLFVVDNYQAHPNIQLHNIKFFFCHPIKQMLVKLLETQNNNNIKSVTILDAINLLSLADPKDNILLAQLIRENKLMNSVNYDNFINVDNNVVVREELTDTDLVNQGLQEEETEDIEDGDTEGETAVITNETL